MREPSYVARVNSALDQLDAARRLRPGQVAHRPLRLVPPRLLAAGLRAEEPPLWRALATGTGVVTAPQSGLSGPPHETGAFASAGLSRPASAANLWTIAGGHHAMLYAFHVHGFDDLGTYVAGERTACGDRFWTNVLQRWLAEAAEPTMPAWHPYPTSRRIVAWCAAISTGGWPEALVTSMRRSLYRQLRYLRRRVEHDIGGNHVIENTAALAIGGACSGDVRIERSGRRMLDLQLRRQVLYDGGHEERSPAYHRAVVERVRDAQTVLARAGRPSRRIDEAVSRMDRWMRRLAGPDGTLPRLNDSWDGPGVASTVSPIEDLSASGYVVLRHGPDQAVLDVGRLCPDHLPPHAHADALSFVLWADGAPLIVDPGSGAYDGPDRLWCRATATHNTVEVDGKDQCVLLGPFRAARLPSVWREPVKSMDGAVVIRAGHDGFARLPDPVEHRRTFCWLPGDGLVVIDRLACRRPHRVRTSLHLASSAKPGKGGIRIKSVGPGAPAEWRHDRVAPYLGVFEPALVLERRLQVAPGEAFGWSLLRTDATIALDGDRLRIRRPGRPPVVVLLA